MGTIENFKTFNNYVFPCFSVDFSNYFVTIEANSPGAGEAYEIKLLYRISRFSIIFNTECCRTKLLCFLLLLSLSFQCFTA